MTGNITDKRLLRRRLRRAHLGAAPGADFLLSPVIADLVERLGAVERRFDLGVAFAGQTDGLADALVSSGKVERVVRIEATEAALRSTGYPAVVADEESLPLALGSVDLFVSTLAFQWTNDLPGALVQIRQALRPDGLLLAAMTGGRTLSELREAMFEAETELRGGAGPRVTPAAEMRDVGALLQRAGFALPVVDRDTITVRYDSAFHLFKDLRAMGATITLLERDKRPVTRRLLVRAGEIYAERFSDPDGRIRATFDIISLSGWAPHPSQQSPARRGSATISLADVLGSGAGKQKT